MGKFGWSYPPGAETDPNAPYNQDADESTNDEFRERFGEYDTPWRLYRTVYKAVACGPAIGFTVYEYHERTIDVDGETYPDYRWGEQTYYCDALRQLGSFDEMDKAGTIVRALHVSSIVEGWDEGVPEITIKWDPLNNEPVVMSAEFWKAVHDVGAAASVLWDETHGCDKCADLHGLDWERDTIPVHEDCDVCLGEGVAI